MEDATRQLATTLMKAMRAVDARPLPEPLPISPWLASALLQKAFRRGAFEFAARAASTLLAAEPVWTSLMRLWIN